MGSTRKRSRPAVKSLSNDGDSHPPKKQPRLSSSQLSSSQGPSLTQALEVEDPDAHSLNQVVDSWEPELYGSLPVKIVGCRYYNGIVSPGELTICRREPNNPYDPNAIRVDNVQGNQIGHFPRTVVEKLAPYIDANEILIEAKITGMKGIYDCPASIFIFGTSDPLGRAQLENRLKQDRLLKATELKKTREEANIRRASLKITGSSTVSLNDHPDQTDDTMSMEYILQHATVLESSTDDAIIKSFAVDEDALRQLPSASQPQEIQSQLLPYQLQALAWVTAKENPQFPRKGSTDNTQLWRVDGRGQYQNLATSFVTRTAPKLLSGGILADDMGLGKTLETISLIVTGGPGPTLIVAPMTVMSNWSQQIERHVHPKHRPNVCIHHGPSRTKDAAELGRYGVVITTYGTMTSENSHGPLFKVQWRRVVLDEGHTIRNSQTQTAKAACSLKAQSRWVLTGTPIVNNIRDLHSLLKFLGITGGLESSEIFSAVIERGLAQRDGRSQKLLQAIMGDLCLRRHKQMKFVDLKLPPKTQYVHRISFTDSEQKKYDALLEEARGVLDDVRKNQKAGKGGQGIPSVLERLLRLRQMCCHWALCKERVKNVLTLLEDQNLVDLTPENRKTLEEALRFLVESSDDCAICLDTLSDAVITHCKHAFCRKCIMEVIRIQHKCPMCRTDLSEDKLLEPAKEDDGNLELDEFDELAGSSKTDALLKILDATLLKNPSSKVIVFSQWTSFLNIVQRQLQSRSYGFSRINGTMKPAARDSAIEQLEKDPNTRIMLASLGVCSVGLNLVAADTVVLADSWWAPAIEDQAIDRVHRLGQTKPTTVWRLVMEGSVEERVLKIQEEKRELVSKAFQEKGKRVKAKETRLADIAKLLA